MTTLTDKERSDFDQELNRHDYKPAVYQAASFDPDKQAEIIAFAESRKLPMDTVERNLPELQRRDKFDSFDLDTETHPKTAKYFSDDRNSRVSVDDLFSFKGLETTVDNMEHGFLSNAGRGALDRVNQLTGNLLELYGNYEEGFSKTLNEWGIPNPGINFGDDGISWSWDIDPSKKSAIGEVGKAVSSEESAYGYAPRYTWEKFKGEMTASSMVGFAMEQGIKSIPDMIAAVATLPAYIASRTEEIAETRVKNDERKEVEGSDLLTALPTAVLTALFERYATKFVFGANKAKSAKSAKDVGIATMSGIAVEGGTEFAQEGIEYVGETAGTKKKMSLGEMFDRQLAGLVAGGVIGGTIKGSGATMQATGNLINKNVTVGAESMAEQETIDQLISFSQSSTTRGRTNGSENDRFKEFVGTLNTKKQIHISNEAINEAIEQGIELPSYVTDQLGGTITDITISVQDFTTDLAANEDLMGVIREHIKLNPHTLTQSESQESEDLSLKALFTKAAKERKELTESEAIYNDVKDQIVNTERQGELTAKWSAAIFPKYVANKASKLGISAKEYYDRMGFKVVSDKVEPAEVVEKTDSGSLYQQDFGDIQLEQKVITPSGKKGVIKKPAQAEWNKGIKRRKQVERLRGCINA